MLSISDRNVIKPSSDNENNSMTEKTDYDWSETHLMYFYENLKSSTDKPDCNSKQNLYTNNQKTIYYNIKKFDALWHKFSQVLSFALAFKAWPRVNFTVSPESDFEIVKLLRSFAQMLIVPLQN